ncbi:hypothetical protein RZS08_52575, partial [Arthrospira platensis SPKY1]|nr:hypothetical protein [Arthrospira platensis SPKY1]
MASVPRMRTSVAVSGTVSASGTPSEPRLASSEWWKSTRNAQQQAPQRVQWSSRIRVAAFGPAALLVLLSAAAGAGVVASRRRRGRLARRLGRQGGDSGQSEVAPVRINVVDRLA